jgi:prolyl-tRNA synthetase
MRYSKMFIPTMKEDPKEAEVLSHRLMLWQGLYESLHRVFTRGCLG